MFFFFAGVYRWVRLNVLLPFVFLEQECTFTSARSKNIKGSIRNSSSNRPINVMQYRSVRLTVLLPFVFLERGMYVYIGSF